jgi:hypothetical protein
MSQADGAYTFQTVIDWQGYHTRAGGILLYQDDNTLIRYGAGLDFDGDVTLTVKSPERGLYIVGRGLLTGERTTLRLARKGTRFCAWCSDGHDWYRCGEAEASMRLELQVGLFAECAYRELSSLTRCTTRPVHFAEVRAQTGSALAGAARGPEVPAGWRRSP